MCHDNILHRMVFDDHCPMFYMIPVGSFQLEVFYDSIPDVSQTELSSSFPNPSFSLAAFFFESGRKKKDVVYFFLAHLITLL